MQRRARGMHASTTVHLGQMVSDFHQPISTCCWLQTGLLFHCGVESWQVWRRLHHAYSSHGGSRGASGHHWWDILLGAQASLSFHLIIRLPCRLPFYPQFADFGTYRAEGPIVASRGHIFLEHCAVFHPALFPALACFCCRRALSLSLLRAMFDTAGKLERFLPVPPGDLDMFLPDGMLMSGTTVQAAAERQVGCPINLFLLGHHIDHFLRNYCATSVGMTTSRGNLLKSYVPDDASKWWQLCGWFAMICSLISNISSPGPEVVFHVVLPFDRLDTTPCLVVDTSFRFVVDIWTGESFADIRGLGLLQGTHSDNRRAWEHVSGHDGATPKKYGRQPRKCSKPFIVYRRPIAIAENYRRLA